MEQTFPTDQPVDLYVELGSGRLQIHAQDVATTTVTVDGPGSDDVAVEQRGSHLSVVQPFGWGFLGADAPLVTVTLPRDSRVAAKLGRAPLHAVGRLGSVRVKSGSGGVDLDELGAEASIDAGSGDVTVNRADRSLRVRSGSGRITVGRAAGTVVASSGSGGVAVGTALASASLKSGSGAVRVQEASADLSLKTGSGDVSVGRISRGQVMVRAASGDVAIGVPPGVPVWTDITSVSGTIRSTLPSAGRPADGHDHVEIRARTVSGDVHLAPA